MSQCKAPGQQELQTITAPQWTSHTQSKVTVNPLISVEGSSPSLLPSYFPRLMSPCQLLLETIRTTFNRNLTLPLLEKHSADSSSSLLPSVTTLSGSSPGLGVTGGPARSRPGGPVPTAPQQSAPGWAHAAGSGSGRGWGGAGGGAEPARAPGALKAADLDSSSSRCSIPRCSTASHVPLCPLAR